MDLHDGIYCIGNPAYNPTEGLDADQSDIMLEAKETVVKLMYAVAEEAKTRRPPEVGDVLTTRPGMSEHSPRRVEWDLAFTSWETNEGR